MSRAGVAFGFRIDGLDAATLTSAPDPPLPTLRVRERRTATAPGAPRLDDDGACLPLAGGDWLLLDRHAQTATYATAEPVEPDRLVHPLLAPAAGLMARWLGREVFHAGAFVTAAGAWAVSGDNEAGKSTLLAALALAGHPVLTDDLLVVEGGRAYAGPRCIDLRDPTVLNGADAAGLRRVRGGTRERLDLPDVDAALPLRGWYFLEWGTTVELVPCTTSERMQRLAAQRRWPTGPMDARALLELGSLPAWTLRRPRGGRHIADVVARLV